MTKEMFDALVSLFQRKKMNRKMILRNKLRSVHMSILDNVTSYLMRITQVHDGLASIGEKIDDIDLMNHHSQRMSRVHKLSKGEQLKDQYSSYTSSVGSETLEGKKEFTPSSSIRILSWYEMTLMDSQEHEASRSTL
jgi:hypothetical protein